MLFNLIISNHIFFYFISCRFVVTLGYVTLSLSEPDFRSNQGLNRSTNHFHNHHLYQTVARSVCYPPSPHPTCSHLSLPLKLHQSAIFNITTVPGLCPLSMSPGAVSHSKRLMMVRQQQRRWWRHACQGPFLPPVTEKCRQLLSVLHLTTTLQS